MYLTDYSWFWSYGKSGFFLKANIYRSFFIGMKVAFNCLAGLKTNMNKKRED